MYTTSKPLRVPEVSGAGIVPGLVARKYAMLLFLLIRN